MIFRFFEGLVSPFSNDPPTQPPEKLWGFIWHYTKPFKWLLLASIIMSATAALIEVLVFDFVGSVVDWMTDTTPEAFWSEHGMTILVICGLLAFVWPILTLIDELFLLQGTLSNFPMAIRWRGHRYLLRQSTFFYSTDFAGRIATKLMQSALGVREVIIKLTNLCVYIAVYFGSAVMLFTISDWRLSIPIFGWLALYISMMIIFLPKLQKWSQRSSDARSILTGRVVDAYTNIQTVKLFASHDAEEDYARESMQDVLNMFYPKYRVITMMSFGLNAINGMFVASTIGLGTWLWTQDVISVGAVAFAGALAMRIQGLSHYFLWEFSGLFEQIGAVHDGMVTLSRPVAVSNATDAKSLIVSRGEITYDNVTFQYGQDKSVVKDLRLQIAPGEKVGLVGRSGAGKSTLVTLLLRLWDVESGQIRIDGQAIHSVTQESLRAQIGVVTQDTSLFHRSIRENVAYGRINATDDQIIAAIKRAEAWEFIQELEDQKGRRGLDAHVGERGVKLSGGQRQRVALARVILKDAPILVMDEATSALDSEAEAAIQGRMDDLMSGKTVIAVAHRLSTIAAMDRLIVMDQGEIVENGTHDALIKSNGIYASLWARQSGGFLNAGPVNAEQ